VIETYKSFLEYSKNKNTLLVMASTSQMPMVEINPAKIICVSNLTCDMKSVLLKHSSVLLFTELNQTISNLQIEAMAQGVCILACNSGGSLETIVHEYTGYLLAANSQLWAQTLKQVLDDHQ
jgi:alpha-1,3/alpha-1,6-mannosyltransferase